MSKEVGAGGRLDIFLDSAGYQRMYSTLKVFDNHACSPALSACE